MFNPCCALVPLSLTLFTLSFYPLFLYFLNSSFNLLFKRFYHIYQPFRRKRVRMYQQA